MSKLSSKQADETKSLLMMNLGVELPEFDKTKYPHGGYAKLRDFGWGVWIPKTKCKPDDYSRLIRFDDLPSSSSLSCAIAVDELQRPCDIDGFMYDQSIGPEFYICGVRNGELRFGIVTEEYDDCNFYLEDGLFAFCLSEEDYHYIGEDIDIFFNEIGKEYIQKQAEKIIEKDGYTPEDFLELAIFRPDVVRILMTTLVLNLPDSPKIVYGSKLSISELRTVERWLIVSELVARDGNDGFLDEKEKKDYEEGIISICSELGMQTILQNFSFALGILLANTDHKEMLSVNPPQALSELCARMLNPKEWDIVYNPFSALGGIVQALPYNEVRGEEADANLWFESMGYEYAVGNADAYYKSSVENINPISTLRDPLCVHKYIASILPLNLTDKEKVEIFNMMLDRLASDGTLVCVMPFSFTTRSIYKPLRQRLLGGDYAIDIVSLPSLYEPYSSVGICLVRVHRIEHDYQRKLTLVDGKGFVKSGRFSPKQLLIESLMEAINETTDVTTIIPHELVQDTILNPERYMTLRDLPQLSKGYQYLPLKQLVSVLSEEDETSSTIFLSTVGNLMKYGDIKEKPITVPHNVIAVKANENVVTEDYLLHELHAEYVQQQFKAFANGATLKRISRRDLMKIQIAVPSIDEQRKVTEAYYKSGLDQAHKELEMAFARYKEDTHLKKHAIGQDLADLVAGWENLMYVRQRENGHLDDNMTYANMTVAEIEDSIGYLIEVVRKQIDEFTIADDKKSNDKINLYDYFNEFVKSHKSSRFSFATVECVKELRNVSVYFSKPALEHVVKNIIFNAKVHGFEGLNIDCPAKNRVQIWISTDDERVTVTIANNGKPMHETIRKRMFEYSNSSVLGKEGHRGTGCYQAKQLMTENGGDIELLPADNDFPVIFKLTFNNSNINDYEK